MDDTIDVTLTNDANVVVPTVPAAPAAVVPVDDDDSDIVGSDGPYITLISSDDKQYQISKSAAMHSIFIIDSLGLDDIDDENEEDIDNNDNNTKKEEDVVVSQDAETNDNDDRKTDHNEEQQQEQSMIINVLRVKGKCLQQVIDFLTHYTSHRMDDIPRLLDGTTFDSVIKQEWYRNYIYNILDDNDTDDDDDDNTDTDTDTIDIDENDSAITIDTSDTTGSTDVKAETTTTTKSQSNNSSTTNNNNNNENTTMMYIFPKNRRKLLQLLAAANYMTIKPLLELICLWVTFQLQNKNYEQIRQFLYFPQITPDQEELARKKLPWIFEE